MPASRKLTLCECGRPLNGRRQGDGCKPCNDEYLIYAKQRDNDSEKLQAGEALNPRPRQSTHLKRGIHASRSR
jgi:hypothetical protein